MSQDLGIGIIGFGFMGRTHAAAYRDAKKAGYDCQVLGICDRRPPEESLEESPGRRGNLEKKDEEPLFDAGAVRFHTDPKELFADPKIELVSICTPTDSHVNLALEALEAGKHVLLEKPIALDSDSAQRLAEVASSTETLCMPAMCMRFWPGWTWLKETIETEEFGAVRSASFRRIGPPPNWSPEVYSNVERTGGALFDLHIHDADFVRFCFGAPVSVSASGSLDHLTCLYHFDPGPTHVVCEGGWDATPGFPFHMGFTVIFEQATAVFSLGSETPLTLAIDGETREIALEDQSGYDGEIRHLLDAVRNQSPLRATCSEALELTRMLEAERKSLEIRQSVSL